MQIKWLNHPTKPELNGTKAHVAREFAITAIGYGQAEEVKAPKRGSAEWLEWMAEQETQRQNSIPVDQRATAQPLTPVWHVKKLLRGYGVEKLHISGNLLFTEGVVLAKRGGPDLKAAEEEFIETLQSHGCPKEVIKQYLIAKGTPDAVAQDRANIEKAKRESYDRLPAHEKPRSHFWQ